MKHLEDHELLIGLVDFEVLVQVGIQIVGHSQQAREQVGTRDVGANWDQVKILTIGRVKLLGSVALHHNVVCIHKPAHKVEVYCLSQVSNRATLSKFELSLINVLLKCYDAFVFQTTVLAGVKS